MQKGFLSTYNILFEQLYYYNIQCTKKIVTSNENIIIDYIAEAFIKFNLRVYKNGISFAQIKTN